MYVSRFYFCDVISLECEKTPMTSPLFNTKCHWLHFAGNSGIKKYTSCQEYPLSQKTIQENNSCAFGGDGD